MNIKNLIQKIAGSLALLTTVMALMPNDAQAGAFTAGDLAVLQAAASANNTTCSIIEINTTTAGQAAIQTIAIDGVTTPNELRISGSATSTGYLATSDDGTLLAFTGANSANTSANVNTLNPRGVGTLNAAGTFNLPTTYTGISGNQPRCATTTNNSDWFISDQGGIYSNGASGASPSGNYRSVKSFGGTVYVFSASATQPSVGTLAGPTGGTVIALPGLPNGGTANQDFYLISTGSNGTAYDVLYILATTSGTAGTISKYSLVSGNWTANGTYTTAFGGFGLCAAKSGGGAALYVTSGTGASTANSVIKLTDTAGFNTTIAITTANNVTLFTTATGTILKGVVFAPVTSATYTVTYTGNGNTGGTAPTDPNSPYAAGATVTVLGNTGSLTRTGFSFAGWNTAADGSGTSYTAGNTFVIAADTTLYAQWTAQPTYTVTYDGNGNTGGVAPTDPGSPYVSGATVTVLGNSGNLSKTGFAFAGWNTAANGTGTAYAPNDTFAIAANTTLFAQWATVYSVTYDGNGNTGGLAPIDPGSPYPPGATVTALGNTGDLTRSGFTFMGWNTAANGTGTAYSAGNTFSISANVTLYAQWTANPPFTAGNLAVYLADNATAANTTFSILEVDPNTPSQPAPVQTVAINGKTGTNALRTSGSGTSTGYLADSDDGSLLCFAGGNTTNMGGNINATILRGVGTLNASGAFTLQTTYSGTNGSQTRSAVSLDNVNWYIGDQDGLYTNNANVPAVAGNFRSVKSFGGTAYVFSASSLQPMVGTFTCCSVTALPGLSVGSSSNQDFYLVPSGANGSAYDMLYVLSASSGAAGNIQKYSLVSGTWMDNGGYSTDFGGFGLCAATNSGGVTLYATTGTGAIAANHVVQLTDTAGYNTAIDINSANNVILYTAAAGTTMKGIAFAPRVSSAPAPVITAINVVSGDVLISFAGGASDTTNDFAVLSAASVVMPLVPIAANITSSGPGQFLATVTGATPPAFYRIKRVP